MRIYIKFQINRVRIMQPANMKNMNCADVTFAVGLVRGRIDLLANVKPW